MSSSGTKVAGTVTRDRPDVVPPMITPVLLEACPRTELPLVRMILALVDLASCLDEACAVLDVDDPPFPALLLLLVAPLPVPAPLLRCKIHLISKWNIINRILSLLFG